MYLGSTPMDFKNPLAAPDKAAFLNPPLFFVGLLFKPEGPGVAGSFLIPAGVTGSFLILDGLINLFQ